MYICVLPDVFAEVRAPQSAAQPPYRREWAGGAVPAGSRRVPHVVSRAVCRGLRVVGCVLTHHVACSAGARAAKAKALAGAAPCPVQCRRWALRRAAGAQLGATGATHTERHAHAAGSSHGVGRCGAPPSAQVSILEALHSDGRVCRCIDFGVADDAYYIILKWSRPRVPT